MPEQNQNNLKNRKVNWVVFTFIIGIIIIAFGWVFNGMAGLNNKVENTNNDIVEVKIFLGEIKTDLSWIKQEIQKINDK